MANSYYDCTGVLVLGKVTPVIEALFGAFNLKESESGNGEVSFAKISESDDLTWDDLLDNFEELIEQLALPGPDVGFDTVGEYLDILANHFGAAEDKFILDLIGKLDFEDNPDLATLFAIAARFDDGHGIKAMKLEGCWHSDRHSLFAFGGDGEYHSQNFRYSVSSSRARELGEAVDAALVDNDLDTAASRLMNEVEGMLKSVTDETIRDQLTAKLGQLISKKVSNDVLSNDKAVEPVIVIELDSGTIVQTSGSHPAKVVFLDSDTEGGDSDQIMTVAGQEYYVTRGSVQTESNVHHGGAAFVARVLEDLAEVDAAHDDEDAGEEKGGAPRA